jgi:diaminohydroxyphosphoribosylaminopyrimidine deaminase/5-amino-6-(5-phosphoribosylamino)uracil reductase
MDLSVVLDELGRRGINELHLEVGARLNGAWLAAGLVDELLIYQAPKLLGQGQGVAQLPTPLPFDDGQRWHWLDVLPFGSDLRMRLRRPG